MLTRTQVEYLANEMSVISYSTAQLQMFCRQVLDHDAALRAEIERLTQDRDQWKSWCEQTPSADMVRQLAQAQQRIKELEEYEHMYKGLCK